MQSSELLTEIQQRGAAIRANGDRLRVTGDNLLNDELRGAIIELKPELMALLSASASTSASTCGSTLRAYRYDPEQALSTFLSEHPTLKPTPQELEELRAKFFNKLPAPGVTCDRCMPIKVPKQHHNNFNQQEAINE
jgi:hypothetical protein